MNIFIEIGLRIWNYHKSLIQDLRQYIRSRPAVWKKNSDNGAWGYFVFWLGRQRVVRGYVLTPFLMAEFTFYLALVIHVANFKQVTGYIMSFVPTYSWWFIVPLWIVALEILWSRRYRNWHWRHEALYFALYRYGPDSFTSMATTMVIRLVKGGLMMGYLYAVMYGVDERLGTIFHETVWQLWPLGVLTAMLYVLQPIYGYITFGTFWDTGKTLALLCVFATVVTLYYLQAKSLLAQIPLPQVETPDWLKIPDVTFAPTQAPNPWSSVIIVGAVIGIVLIVLALIWIGNKIYDALQRVGLIERISNFTLPLWWFAPVAFFVLLVGITSVRWFREIYIPDRLKEIAEMEAAAEEEVPVEPPSNAVPSVTFVPSSEASFTNTPPATATFTPVSPTATDTPTLAFTPTLTSTLAPSATATVTSNVFTSDEVHWDSAEVPAGAKVDNPHSFAVVRNGRFIVVSESPNGTKDADAIADLTDLIAFESHGGCHINIPETGSIFFEVCYFFEVDSTYFVAPRIINAGAYYQIPNQQVWLAPER